MCAIALRRKNVLTVTFYISSIVYLRVGGKGFKLLAAASPKIIIRFPKRGSSASTSETKKLKTKTAKSAVGDHDGWLKAKSKTTKRKASTLKVGKKTKTTSASRAKRLKTATKQKTKIAKAAKKTDSSSEVIEVLSDESDCDPHPSKKLIGRDDDGLWRDETESEHSDSEFELE